MPDPPEAGLTSSAQNQTVKWPFVIFRVFAIANFIFVACGLFFLSSSVFSVSLGYIGNSPAQPYFLQAYWLMTAANIVLLALSVFGGVRLLQLRTVGVTICNAVFAAEIFYFISIPFLWGYPATPVSMSVAAATGVGNMGVTLQEICGYPILGLIFLNIARRRLNGPIPAHRSMKSKAPPSKLTVTLMRILAVVTFLQVLLGIGWMARVVWGLWGIRNVWRFRHSQHPYLFPSLILLNLAVAGVLVLIAFSLWKLNKRTLFVLCGVLSLEFGFMIFAIFVSAAQAERFGLAGVMSLKSFVLGPNSMLVIWSQFRTGYLLVAPALIFATYLSRRFSKQAL